MAACYFVICNSIKVYLNNYACFKVQFLVQKSPTHK